MSIGCDAIALSNSNLALDVGEILLLVVDVLVSSWMVSSILTLLVEEEDRRLFLLFRGIFFLSFNTRYSFEAGGVEDGVEAGGVEDGVEAGVEAGAGW